MKVRIEIAQTPFYSKEQLEARRCQIIGKTVRLKYQKQIVGRVTNAWIQNGTLYAEFDLDGLEIMEMTG